MGSVFTKGSPTKKVPVNSSKEVIKTNTALASSPGCQGKRYLVESLEPACPDTPGRFLHVRRNRFKGRIGDPDAEHQPDQDVNQDHPRYGPG